MKRKLFGQRLTNNKAQAMLEFSFCVIILLFFFMASVSAFIWAARTFVARQHAFYSSSTDFNYGRDWSEDFYQQETMHLMPVINRE